MPSFREHATSAGHVVIGDVVAVDPSSPWRDEQGGSSRFTLRVDHAIRGQFERTMRLRDLAYLPCSDHIVVVRKGDRIALAIGASGFAPRIDFSTAAWIEGTPLPFGERTTVPEVFTLFGLRPPDTSTVTATPEQPLGRALPISVLAGCFAAVVAYRRTRLPGRDRAHGG